MAKPTAKKKLALLLAALIAHRSDRANVCTPDLVGWQDGEKGLRPGNDVAESMAQNLIDRVPGHAHLKEARVWTLFRIGTKTDADGRVELGHARKTSGLVRALAVRSGEGEKGRAPDFLITLNGEEWQKLSEIQRLALLDHQLTHCGVTIAGRYVPPSRVKDFAAALGKDHLETCANVRDEKGRILVRYRRRRGEIKPGDPGYGGQPLAWRIRHHDVEDFIAVVARWGPWTPQVKQLVDVLEAPEDFLPLLEGSAS